MTAQEQQPRTAVVTGASGGIGRASALAFALRGDRLALIARGRAGLAAAVREAEQAGAAKASSTKCADRSRAIRRST